MVGVDEKRIIRQLYVNNLKSITSDLSVLMRQLEMSTALLESFISSLLNTESLTIDSEKNIHLTQLGRKQISVVMTGGTYDILHIGHLFTLEQARFLGDALVVVMATDKNVKRLKNRLPANSMDDRSRVLESVKNVDAVIKGSETDFMSTVDFIDPDIIALGYDQAEEERALYEDISARGHSHVKIIRLQKHVPGKSTTKIMQDIINHNYRK
ncbi:MAG: adenylyltransferase/cytidyltransferase family protein [Candidatus Heimdallarchaeota archaeon]|nr:adenylyltransferase/cytidyltransferase family protein [Candidatus Heimdallarchaeota archaeon]